MDWLRPRFWLFQKQIQDLRVRLRYRSCSGGYEAALVFEKRKGWFWKKYAEIGYLDVPNLLTLIGDVQRFLRG